MLNNKYSKCLWHSWEAEKCYDKMRLLFIFSNQTNAILAWIWALALLAGASPCRPSSGEGVILCDVTATNVPSGRD